MEPQKSIQEKYEGLIIKLDEDNHPEVLVQALQILYKLFNNIAMNPMEQKFRNIKTSNNTLKQKVFNVNGIMQLLDLLGFQPDSNSDVYTLPDQCLGNLLSVINVHKDHTDLVQSKLESEEAYEKQLEIIKNKKILNERLRNEQDQQRKLQELSDYDKQERKYIKAKDSKANNLQFGATIKTAEQCGINLNQGGGGG